MSEMDEAYNKSQRKIGEAQKALETATDPDEIARHRRTIEHEQWVWN
jgi:hypothetical protein